MSNPDRIWALAPVAMLIADHDGVIKAANAAAEHTIGMSARALGGKGLGDVIAAPAEIQTALTRFRHSQAQLSISDLPVRFPNDRRSVAHVKMVPFDDDILVTFDLDDTAMAAQAPGFHAAIGMAQMLAHEIKNPLAGISGAAQFLEMSLNEDDRAMTRLIVEESQRIVSLLDQVEQFGDDRLADQKAFNLHDALRRARHSAELGVAASLDITENYDPSLPSAHVDGDQVVQALLNLIKNASEAGATKLTLRSYFDTGLRHRDTDGTELRLPLHIDVIDNGPGLPAGIADHIFDPFVTGRQNGTGLGLALVSKLMHDNRGMVAVDSSPQGCCFRLSFQRAPDTEDEV